LKRADDGVLVAVVDGQRCRVVLVPDDETDDNTTQRVDGHQHDADHVQLDPRRVLAAQRTQRPQPAMSITQYVIDAVTLR